MQDFDVDTLPADFEVDAALNTALGDYPTAAAIATAVWTKAGRTLTSGASIVVGPTASSKPIIPNVRVLKNATVPMSARVLLLDGTDAQQADITSITYSIYEVDCVDPNEWTVVAGFDGVSLTVSEVLYDTLQTDARAASWNFRHTPDISVNPAFTKIGIPYTAEYRMVPAVAGQEIVVRFAITVI